MRFYLSCGFLALLLASSSYGAPACEGTGYLRLISGRFSLCLPLALYKDASVLNGEGALTKLSDGASFGVHVVTPDSDSMPEDFDMRTYPELALGLRKPEGLPATQQESIAKSVEVLKNKFPSESAKKNKINGKTFFTLYRPNTAVAYVVGDDVKDQILFFTFEKIDEKKMESILQGVR